MPVIERRVHREFQEQEMRVRSHPLGRHRRPRDTPIWKLEAALRCRSCGPAPSAHMIKLTETGENHALRLGASGRGEVSPSGRVDSRYAKVLLNGGRGARTDETEGFARFRSLAQASSSYGNFASNSASEIPNAVAIALFGAPNAIIARTKRRSASAKLEALHFSAASASLSASTRGVIPFGFRPEPDLAPPRPTPLDFVISNL